MRKLPIAALVLCAVSSAFATLPSDLQAIEGLEWAFYGDCSAYASISNNHLVIDIPASTLPAPSVIAWASVPRRYWEGGEGFLLSVQGKARVATPQVGYKGLKCQMWWGKNDGSVNEFPNIRWNPDTSYDKTFYTAACFNGVEPDFVILQFGIQESTGKVDFDLSTVKGGIGLPYVRKNDTKHLVYPTDVLGDVRRRGVMMEWKYPMEATNETTHLATTLEDDFATLEAWGVNLVRFPFYRYGSVNPNTNMDVPSYLGWVSNQLDLVEAKVLPLAKAHGQKVVIDLHCVPGSKAFNGGMNLFDRERWGNGPDFATGFVEAWRMIAERLKGNEDAIYGYDLFNEPDQQYPSVVDYLELQELAAKAIREIDPKTTVIVESNRASSPDSFAYLSPIDCDNVIYQVHMYEPHAFTHQKVAGTDYTETTHYPDTSRGWNRQMIVDHLRPVLEFSKRHNAKIYVGEFSAASWAEGAEQYLADCISVFEEYGWDWSYHSFREWPGWDVEKEGTSYETMHPAAADTPRKQVLLAGFGASQDKSFVVAPYNEFVVDVESGAHTLTQDELSALGDKTLVKRGAGSLLVGSELSGFDGDIYVMDGCFVASERDASLGTAIGHTFTWGGTLVNRVGSATDGSATSFATEGIYLCGEGFEGSGALVNEAEAADFCRSLTLWGDALVATGDKRLDFRAATFDMQGNTLATASDGNSIFFVNTTIVNDGDFVARSGGLEFQTWGGGSIRGNPDSSVSIVSNAVLSLYNSEWINRSLLLAEGAGIRAGYSLYPHCWEYPEEWDGQDRSIWMNTWQGPVELEGRVAAALEPDVPFTFWGSVSGDGGFDVSGGGWLQLQDSGNSFTGGVSVVGVLQDGEPVGGVAVMSQSALPPDGGALRLENASVEVQSSNALLPDIVCPGEAKICAASEFYHATAKSLVKEGEGTLSIPMALEVAGKADILGGTLRFGARPVLSGLKWWRDLEYINSYTEPVPKGTYRGIDGAGASAAYQVWDFVEGCNDGYYYTGFIKVPGDEGDEVTCNFISSIARVCRIDVGGKPVIQYWDNWDSIEGGVGEHGYDRLCVSRAVTLKAGWQPIYICMANFYNDTRGPQGNEHLGWVWNFGIGVDWQGRREIKPENYVKLLDDGDGRFLRATLDAENRPSFSGGIAFAPGSVLDVNDTEPYAPYALPELCGTTTITNGEVHVGSWVVGPDDIGQAGVMQVASGARLVFPDGARLSLEGDFSQSVPRGANKVRPLLRVADGGAVENLSGLKVSVPTGWRVVASANGDGLDVEYRPGFSVRIR